MADIREDILARLVELVATVPNLVTIMRNNTDWVEQQMPVAMVLDGDEEVVAGNDGSRPSNRPLLVEMTPQITIIEQSETIGSDLTTFRRELVKLVLADATLIALTGVNGAIRYTGCETGFDWSREHYGQLTTRFEFKYPLKPTDL